VTEVIASTRDLTIPREEIIKQRNYTYHLLPPLSPNRLYIDST